MHNNDDHVHAGDTLKNMGDDMKKDWDTTKEHTKERWDSIRDSASHMADKMNISHEDERREEKDEA